MSKAYIVTKVTHSDANDAPKVVAVELAYSEAVKAKIADMRDVRSRYSEDDVFQYDEDEGCIIFREGEENCIVWGVEEKDIRIPLTPLQFTNLNGIAESIETNANDSYFSYADSLSEEEDEYLLSTLANRGIAIDKENEVEMRGEEARAWLAKHGKENGNG